MRDHVAGADDGPSNCIVARRGDIDAMELVWQRGTPRYVRTNLVPGDNVSIRFEAIDVHAVTAVGRDDVSFIRHGLAAVRDDPDPVGRCAGEVDAVSEIPQWQGAGQVGANEVAGDNVS